MRLFAVLLIAAGVAGCINGGGNPRLTYIESIIQSDPATAYQELKSIDRKLLVKEKERALYSLLMSLALDKNYIDIKSDSLIAPAVEYYSRSCDNCRKFLSYYCAGRVYENAEEYDSALSFYIKAGNVPGRSIPQDYIIRLHARKGTVYYHQFALDKALDEYETARQEARGSDNPDFYIYRSLDVARVLASMGRTPQSCDELDTLKQWMSEKHLSPPADYYNLRLRVFLLDKKEDTAALESAYKDYYKCCSDQGLEVDHLLSGVYYAAGNQPAQAAHELDLISGGIEGLDTFSFILYYTTLAKVQRQSGNYKEALSAVELYNNKLQEQNLAIHRNDVRFLEERAANEIERSEARHRSVFLFILLVVAVIVTIASLTHFVNAKRRFDFELEQAKTEYRFLSEMNETSQICPEEIKRTIRKRVLALRPFIISERPLQIKDNDRLRETNDKRKDMLCSIGLMFAASYPEFVLKLSRLGLSAEEIGLCCMYVSGYSAKELNSQKNSNKTYLDNAAIRQKLGLDPNGIKLSTWLKALFEETA